MEDIHWGETDLLIIRFPNCVIRYTKDYEVIITGSMWPRQLSTINSMILCYKEQSIQDKKKSESTK